MRSLLISVTGEPPHVNVVKEILNHLGLIYENKQKGKKYACEIEIVDSFTKDVQTKNKLMILTNFIQKNAIEYLAGSSKKNLDYPVLNYYEEVLLNNVRQIFKEQGLPLVRKWPWPKFRQAAFISSHDIDTIFTKHSWHRTTPLKSKVYLSMKNLLPTFDKGYFNKMLKTLNRIKINSTFFFFHHYDDKKSFRAMLKRLEGSKHEIGLHSISNNETELMKEIQELKAAAGKEITGVRMHQLKLRVPESWKEMEKHLEYDMSFYKNKKFGYRAGLCLPYHPLIEGRFSNLLEIPTLFMDWTAIDQEMKLSDIRRQMYDSIKYVEKFNGLICVNYHNEYFSYSGYGQIMKSLEFIAHYVNKHKYWKATGREVDEWWRKRERARVNIAFTENGVIKGITDTPLPLVVENGKQIKIEAKGRFEARWEK